MHWCRHILFLGVASCIVAPDEEADGYLVSSTADAEAASPFFLTRSFSSTGISGKEQWQRQHHSRPDLHVSDKV